MEAVAVRRPVAWQQSPESMHGPPSPVRRSLCTTRQRTGPGKARAKHVSAPHSSTQLRLGLRLAAAQRSRLCCTTAEAASTTSTDPSSKAQNSTEASSLDPESMAELKSYLERELPLLFSPKGMSIQGRFEEVVKFEDPITRYGSLAGYLFNIEMLRLLFSPSLYVHSVYQSGPAEITTRWTMRMCFRLLPWQPVLLFTGLSIYGINPVSKKFNSHTDVWDSIADNAYFSKEGLMDLISQCAQLYKAPELMGSPSFETLLRRANYQIRRYDSYWAVETSLGGGGSSSGSAGADKDFEESWAAGHKVLQSWAASAPAPSGSLSLGLPYLVYRRELVGGESSPLGNNSNNSSSSSSMSRSSNRSKFELVLRQPLSGSAECLENLESSGPVRVLQVPQQVVGISTFPGQARAEEFELEEAKLRASLVQDGLLPASATGAFARYWEPTLWAPSLLLGNEVHLPLKDFVWP